MGWIAMDLDGTLLHEQGGHVIPGAAQALQRLLGLGHRVSIWTARFAHFQPHEVEAEKQRIAHQLAQHAIPYSDIYTHHTKPPADVFVDNRAVPFHGDWNQTLAHTLMMLDVPPGHEAVLDEVEDDPGMDG